MAEQPPPLPPLVANYIHAPAGSGIPAVTWDQSVDVSSWTAASGTFVITGTSITTPSSAAQTCQLAGGAPPSFTGFERDAEFAGVPPFVRLEATPRIELGMEVLQTSALPLGYVASV